MDMVDIFVAKQLAGGGGSALPTPTSTDYGKVVGVGRTAVAGTVVVAEQTVTIDDETSAVITPLVTPILGHQYIFAVDDTDYIATCEDEGYGLLIWVETDDNSFGIYVEDDVWYFSADNAGTYTIKVSELSYEYDYALDKYPQYDIVIGTTELDNTLSHYTAIKYNYDDIHQKVLDGELVTGVLVFHYNYDEAVDGDTDMQLLSLGVVQIRSTDALLVFWGYNGSGKRKATLNIDIDTGEFQSVTATTWS